MDCLKIDLKGFFSSFMSFMKLIQIEVLYFFYFFIFKNQFLQYQSNKMLANCFISYKVKKGDSLWSIGREVGLNWRFIHALNKSIVDANKIYIGQDITIPNPTFVYYLSLVADIIMVFTPFKISLFLTIMRYIIQAGSFKKEIITKFCIDNGISLILVGKAELLYNQLGKSNFTKVYNLWSNFWSFGISRIINASEK